jgi:hypothetical protein
VLRPTEPIGLQWRGGAAELYVRFRSLSTVTLVRRPNHQLKSGDCRVFGLATTATIVDIRKTAYRCVRVAFRDAPTDKVELSLRVT